MLQRLLDPKTDRSGGCPPGRRPHPRLLPALVGLLATACATSGSDPAMDAAAPGGGSASAYVVMVSFDGMRYDFFDRADAPNFRRVAEAGVRASGLIPGYPSKTFPNHYGIATGLYPAHHGLVDNTFYDPVFDATYRIGNREAVQDGRWYGGEPIWVTAENQGLRTASFFWVGTEAPVRGVHPTHFRTYDESVPYTSRVDTVLSWLRLPEPDRPRLVMLYFHEPDATAHQYGPDHPAVDSVVRVLDGHLGHLLDGIESSPVADRATVVLVSDHGMEAVPEDHVIYPGDYTDLAGVRVTYSSTQAQLYFGGDTARIASAFRDLSAGLPDEATVYRKGETPDRWRYGTGRRIGDLIVAADPGWVVWSRDYSPWRGGGMHGWDPYYRRMHGIFLAAGPRIPAGQVIPAFENVHIYPFAAELLGVDPAGDIDGRLEVLSGTLRDAVAP